MPGSPRNSAPIKCILAWGFVFGTSACQVEHVPNSEVQLKGGSENVALEQKLVAVALAHKDGGQVFCSGSWIAKNVVLSAGHCVKSPEDGQSKASDFQIKTYVQEREKGPITEKILNVKEVFPHPKYEGKDGPNEVDLSLILTEARPPASTNILELPKSNFEMPRDFLNIASYGHEGVKDNKYIGSGVLRSGKLKIVKFYDREAVSMVELDGQKKIQSCTIDSGSPYFIKGTTGLIQIGVHTTGLPLSSKEGDDYGKLLEANSKKPEDIKALNAFKEKIKVGFSTHCTPTMEGVALSKATLAWVRDKLAQIGTPKNAK
jgi:V8-like Glu-specific endopeptidase